MKNVSAIVVAGGSGSRLKKTSKNLHAQPKGFWPLAGKPLLMHSVQALIDSNLVSEIIIVVPKQKIISFKKWIRSEGASNINVKVVEGGKTRADSVLQGIKKVKPQSSWVLVHDAARPFITKTAIEAVIRRAKKMGAAIIAKPMASTVKQKISGKRIKTVSRTALWEAETPQVAKKTWLKEAYHHYKKHPFEATDESSLLEAIDKPVELVKMDSLNFKITTLQDWKLAENMVSQVAEIKIGQGYDIHRLIQGRPFILGGERLKFSKGPLGHSDGDALLHAISDAILGSLGLGDIGEYFSDTNQKNKNISSSKILNSIVDMAKKQGWAVSQLDCTIHLERPKLGLYKSKIKSKLSKFLNLEKENINIKAKTAEGLGPIGDGEAVACDAMVVVTKGNK